MEGPKGTGDPRTLGYTPPLGALVALTAPQGSPWAAPGGPESRKGLPHGPTGPLIVVWERPWQDDDAVEDDVDDDYDDEKESESEEDDADEDEDDDDAVEDHVDDYYDEESSEEESGG